MISTFYVPAFVAVLTTLSVVLNTRPVQALLNLIVSFIAIAILFFSLGAPFSGALEIIIYAGAIMVMFAFVMMMLNLGQRTEEQEKRWLSPGIWWFPSIMAFILLLVLSYIIFWHGHGALLGETTQSPDQVGILLFGPYILLVELAAFLLLAALIIASHIGRPSDNEGGAL